MPAETPSGNSRSVIVENFARILRDMEPFPADCRMLAVSKGQSVDKIRTLYELGQRDYAENYLSELEVKVSATTDCPGIRWVYIGQLQSNKIARIVQLADEIQTAASEKHLRYIDRYARESGKSPYPVWIEINAGAEATKGGVDWQQVEFLAEFAGSLEGLDLQGLMAIPPASVTDTRYDDAGREPPEMYKSLRRMASEVGRGKLSLGMSGDYRTALKAGSDCVRIGSSLFGPRGS